MTDLQRFRDDLPRMALDTYKEEYAELGETWARLDTKAQGSAVVSGLFLAAAFAWARDPAALGATERVLLQLAIACLVAAVGIAVRALQIRDVPPAPSGDDTYQIIEDMLAPRDASEAEKRAVAFYKDQAELWKAVNNEVRASTLSKARWTKASQTVLLMAGALAAIVAILAL